MKRMEIVVSLCFALGLLVAPLGIAKVDAALAGHSIQALDDAALAATVGGKTCGCVDHACKGDAKKVGCTYDPSPGALPSCYGCDSPITTKTGTYDKCERTAGAGCCDDEDCTPRCVKKCVEKTWTSSKDCSASTQHCASGNPCSYTEV